MKDPTDNIANYLRDLSARYMELSAPNRRSVRDGLRHLLHPKTSGEDRAGWILTLAEILAQQPIEIRKLPLDYEGCPCDCHDEGGDAPAGSP